MPTLPAAHLTLLTGPSISSWGPWALLAVWCLLLLLGISNVLSANTIIRRRYSSGRSKGLSNLKPGAGAKPRPSLPKEATKGKASYAPIWFAVFVGAAMVYGMTRTNYAPIAEEHNVAILEKLDTGEWRMHSDEEGTFVYRPCPDFDNASVIWVGYIADRAKWREYGRCKSIRDTGLGFYYREGHNEWRKVN